MLIAIFVFIFIFYGSVFSGLTVSPDKPTSFRNITIKYKNENRFQNSDKVYAFIYCFSELEATPTAFQILLIQNTPEEWSGTHLLPEKCVFGVVKVGTTNSFDTQNNNFWDFHVYDASGKIVKGSHLKAALSFMGNLPPNSVRNINFDKAQSELENEIKEYPDNNVAKIGLLSLKHDLKEISTEDFAKGIQEIYTSLPKIDDENTAVAMSRALRAINEKEKAEELEKNVNQHHPFSKIAEDKELNDLQKAKTFDDFKSNSLNFISKFTKSSANEKVWLALLKAYINDGKLDEFKEFIKTYQKMPAAVYSTIAGEIIKHKTTSGAKIDGEVSYFINKAMETYKFDLGIPKPDYLTESEWDEQKNKKIAKLQIFLADGFTDDGKYNDAIDNLLKAKSLLQQDADFDLFDDIIENYLKLNDKESAFIMAREAIVNSASSTFSDSVFKEYYFRFTGSAKGYENYLDSLTETARLKRLSLLRNEVLEYPAKFDELLTTEGVKADFDVFNNKVLVVFFWATWCEPCKNAVPAIEKLDDLYQKNPEVDVLNINIWDKPTKRKKEVRKFIAENEIEMPSFVDVKNKIPRLFGLTGLPALVFIDKEGNVRFKEYGFDGEEKMIRDSEDKIQFILENSGK